MSIAYEPIGFIRSPFTDLDQMPIQPTGPASAPGEAEVLAAYVEGLRDLDGFSHVVLVCHLHRSRPAAMTVVPFLDTVPRGVFATRAPSRPNPIAISVVPLVRIEGARLILGSVDLLDGTPVLDIKPYMPDFDGPVEVRTGWYAAARERLASTTSDDRFAAD